jgi:hypothetical protein
MKHKEASQINKSAFQLVEQAKNVTAQNITTAVTKGDLKVDRALLPVLINLIQASIDQGYHQALRQFEAQVDASLKAASAETKSSLKKQ